MRRLLALALVGSLALVACSADTDPATNVTATGATLSATLNWDAGDGPGEVWFEYRRVGDAAWTPTAHDPYPDMAGAGSAQSNVAVSPLEPGTRYEFRVCGFGDKDAPSVTACFDSAGTINGTNYDSFTTAANCNTTVAPSGLQAAINSQPTGATICVSAGSVSATIAANKAGQTIRAAVSGNSIAAVTVNGRVDVSAPNVALRQFNVIQSASDNTAGTVKVTATGATLDHMNIDANGHKSALLAGGGGAGEQADNLAVQYTKLHGATTSTQDHAIYLFKLTGGHLDHSWLYNVAGYILHFNGDVNGFTVDHIVGDDSSGNRFLTFDSDSAAVPDNNLVENSVVTDAGQFLCNQPGTGNVVTSIQISPYADNCSAYDISNLSTARASYVAEGSNYKVVGKPDFQFTPGPQG